MRDKLSLCVLVLLFILFSLYILVVQRHQRVLNIVTPTVIQVDLNNNNIVDDGETFCIPSVESFTSNLSKNPAELADSLGISYEQSLAIGFLADDFANKILGGRNIRLKHFEKALDKPDCKYADIYIDKQNYRDLLNINGFGISNGRPVNQKAFELISAKAKNLKLVIMNHKSLKYHTLGCKYGQAAHDAVILFEREIPKEAKACKFCHIDNKLKKYSKEIPALPPPPNIITDGSFKLILTDFSLILKPDRNCNHAVCKEFVNSINQAQNSIDMAIYGWANIPKVNSALDSAAKRGVKIRIIYDTSSGQKYYYPETLDFIGKYNDVRSDEIIGNKKLTNMLMHNKFAIFDKSKVYTGSMNFSTTGFSGFNHNNVVIINSKSIAEIYEKEFEQMFSGKFHTLKKQTENNSNLQVGNSVVSVYFSPQDKSLTNYVLPLIKNSKKYIYIPAFLFTHTELCSELIQAKERGVDVKIIIDATNTYGEHSAFKRLRKNGIPVKVENFAGKMHAKAMIIDDEYLVAGSTNFSNSGENKNDENLLIIKNPRLTKFYRNYFEYFWKKIPDKYLRYTVKAEGKYSIGSCSDGIDNDFDGKIDHADDGCQ